MSLELEDWTMRVYVKDRRCKGGERILKTYHYTDKHEAWMQEEVLDLSMGLYPKPKYRIEVDRAWVRVRCLMSGKEVKIAAEDRGSACDPSMERYWSA